MSPPLRLASGAALALALGAAGCAAPEDDPGGGEGGGSASDDDAPAADDDATEPASGPPYSLATTLSSDAVAAGDTVALAFRVYDAGGADVTAAFDPRVEVSPATGTTADASGVTFRVAGAYTVTTSIAWDGGEAADADPVQVSAGGPHEVELSLDRARAVAGEPVSASVVVRDAFGNLVPEAATLGTEPAVGVAISGSQVTATRTGEYRVWALAGGASAEAWFAVDPGEAVSVVVELPALESEVGDGLEVAVHQHDGYGNAAADEVALSVSPAGATAWDTFVRFEAEGVYTVTATSVESGATGSAGPVTVDSSGPSIALDTPARGDQVPAGPVAVAGTVTDAVTGVAGVEVGGDPVAVGAGGAFAASASAAFGLNVLEVQAWDADGNASDVEAAFLGGGFLPEGATLEDALVARLSEEGIGELEEAALSALDVNALLSTLASPGTPVFESGDCLAGVEMFITGASAGATQVDLDPRAGGYIQLDATVEHLAIDYSAEYELICLIDGSADGTVSADSLDLSAQLWLSASGGAVDASLSGVSATFHGFDISGDLESDIISLFEDWIEDYAEEAVTDAIEAEVAPVLEEAFGDLSLATEFDLLGATIALEAVPQAVAVDETGLSIALMSRVTGPAHPSLPAVDGALWREATWPTYAVPAEIHLSISDNFLNQLLFAVWRAGALNMDLGAEDLGLDLGGVGDLLSVTALDVTTTPRLPPVLVPLGTGAPEFELQLGEMAVELWGDPGGGPYGLMADVRVGLRAPATLSLSASELSIALGEPEVWFDVAGSDHPVDLELLEGVMGAMLDGLLPELLSSLDGLGSIPIPELSGFGLVSPSLSRDDAPYYYLTIQGGLDLDLEL